MSIIKASGKMVSKMVMEPHSVSMELIIKVILKMENPLEKEFMSIQMVHIIKEIFLINSLKAMVSSGIKKINLFMKDNGKPENLMEKENKPSLKSVYIMVNFLMA